jgi:formyl-CoA transferase/CoA:oxalate CoA-transferase
MWATIGVLAALLERQTSGRGQHIDVSLLDGQLSWLTYVAANALATDRVPGRFGSAHPNLVPYQDFPTADGRVMIAIGNDRLWAQLCSVPEFREFGADAYRTNTDRLAQRNVLVPALAKVLRDAPTEHWLGVLEAVGVPVGPVLDVRQALEQPHVKARELIVELESPAGGTVRSMATPLRFSRTAVSARHAAEELGASSSSVMRAIEP